MSKRPVVGIHAYLDPPIRLSDNDSLIGKHVIVGGAGYGRILFTERSPAVIADGKNITVKYNIFEVLD